MSYRYAILIATTALLAACGTVPQHEAVAPTPPPAAKAGGYLQGDGPGANPPANLDAIPDAVPRSEPLNRYANRPYVALGKTYVPLTMAGTFKQRGIASWYGKKFNGERTSSGEIYDMYGMTAAHPTLPIPSYARITNVANKKTVVVRINDRGPFLADRIIDLSYTAAYKLGIIGNGSAEVEVESIPPNSIINVIPASTVRAKPLPASPAATVAPAAVVASAADAGASAVVAAPTAAASAVAADPVMATTPAAANPVTAPAAAATQPAGSDPGVYLQLGAFKTQEAAAAFLEKMHSKLGDTGKQLKLTSKDGLVRVHIGPYASQSEARSSADSMESKLGFKPMVNLP
jgi:rare lipoprotein A